MHCYAVTTRLEFISAVGKRPLIVRQVGSSFSNFLRVLCSALARMGKRALSKEGGAEQGGKLHDR
jgi:hypothetical protein